MVHLSFLLTNLQTVDCNRTRRKFRDTVNSAVCSQWQSQQAYTQFPVAFWPLGDYASVGTLGTDEMLCWGRTVQKCVRGGWAPPTPATAGITATQVPQPREQALPPVLPGPSVFWDTTGHYIPCDKNKTNMAWEGRQLDRVLGAASKQGRKLSKSKHRDMGCGPTEETPVSLPCPHIPHPQHRGVYTDHFHGDNDHTYRWNSNYMASVSFLQWRRQRAVVYERTLKFWPLPCF